MNVLEKVAKKLADLAQEIGDVAEAELVIPKNEYSLAEAARKLRAALGGGEYIEIIPPTINVSPTGKLSAQDWSVFHANKSYRGNTIGVAVDKCLAANGAEKVPVMSADQVQDLYAAAAPEF